MRLYIIQKERKITESRLITKTKLVLPMKYDVTV